MKRKEILALAITLNRPKIITSNAAIAKRTETYAQTGQLASVGMGNVVIAA
jgi:hypothetical protein